MNATHQQLADAFLEAYRTGTPVAPPRELLEGMTLDDAYAVQLLQEEAFEAQGDAVVGRKIGLTSFAMQQQLGVDQPDFGFVPSSKEFRDGARFDSDDFIAPKVEPELAVVLSHDLAGPGVTRDDAIAAIASVHAAVEVIDSRVRDWDITLVDTVADNASCGAIVWGPPLSIDPHDLGEVTGRLLIDGEEVATGKGTDVMGHPAEPLAWLANVLGERGVALRAGQVVLTGSFTAAHAVQPGTQAVADFPGLGHVTLSF